MQIKYTVEEIKSKDCELENNEVMYTKRICFFMRKVTKESILDDLLKANLLTDQIAKIIENS